MAFKRLPISGPVQTVKISTPYAFAFGALGLEILLRIRFKGVAAGFVAKPVTVSLKVGDQAGTAGVYFHATDRVNMSPAGGCRFFHDCPLFLFDLLFYTQKTCHFVAQKLNSLLTQALLDFKDQEILVL
jgi:hypothetical protein